MSVLALVSTETAFFSTQLLELVGGYLELCELCGGQKDCIGPADASLCNSCRGSNCWCAHCNAWKTDDHFRRCVCRKMVHVQDCDGGVVPWARCTQCLGDFNTRDCTSPQAGLCMRCYPHRNRTCSGTCGLVFNMYVADVAADQCIVCLATFHLACVRFRISQHCSSIFRCLPCIQRHSMQCRNCSVGTNDSYDDFERLGVCVRCEAVRLHPDCAVRGLCAECVQLELDEQDTNNEQQQTTNNDFGSWTRRLRSRVQRNDISP